MPRSDRSRLSPWIQSLILSYGSKDGTGGSSSGRLKAHVIGVGPMPQSQPQGSDSPTGLLFLSDGMLQIPAILTASAWEHVQEQEDRESFSSLVNTTVCIQDYQLQFHMAQEKTKCRFFLSVGELATTAAGPVKENTPCCTTLPSIRLKICQMWSVLLGQEVQESQASQCGFDLTELLGEWQHDCLQAVLEDVRERLTGVSSCPESPQACSSTSAPLQTHPDMSSATSWEVDRVRYKGEKCSSVPIRSLLIPEGDAQQLQTPPNVKSRTPVGLSAASEDTKRDLPQVCEPSETTQPSVDDAEWQIAKPAAAQTDHEANENSPHRLEDSVLDEDMIAGLINSDIRPLSNPWDIFPPPCDTSSSSDVSPEATPTHPLHTPSAAEPKPDHIDIPTSSDLPAHSSKLPPEFCSYLVPYQKPPQSTSLPTSAGSSASVSPPESFSRLLNLPPATEQHGMTAQLNPTALDQEGQILEDTEESVEREAKRKRNESPAEALTATMDQEEEGAEISGSPPSWLFDSQAGSRAKEDSSHQQGQTATSICREAPSVHSDGRCFSYSYQVSGQNLHDLTRFRVAEPWLEWAVKYLVVPKQTDNLHDTTVTSNQTSSNRTEVTSL